MVYKFFDKKTSASGIKNESMSYQQLADKLHRLIIWKFNKRKVQSPNVWGADLADTQLTSTFNKGICFLSFLIDIFSKYSRVISLKDKKGITITNAFQKILKESYRKPMKTSVDKSSKFYDRSMKSWLERSDI